MLYYSKQVRFSSTFYDFCRLNGQLDGSAKCTLNAVFHSGSVVTHHLSLFILIFTQLLGYFHCHYLFLINTCCLSLCASPGAYFSRPSWPDYACHLDWRTHTFTVLCQSKVPVLPCVNAHLLPDESHKSLYCPGAHHHQPLCALCHDSSLVTLSPATVFCGRSCALASLLHTLLFTLFYF